MADADSPNVSDGSGEMLASFEVYVSSPDREADRFLVRAIQEFDGEYGSSNVSDDGGIAREVRRIVKGYFPEGVTVRDVRIRYGESAELTFVLVLSAAYAVYDFIAKYDDFRKGLDHIADDVRTLLMTAGRWSGRLFPRPFPFGPLTTRAKWRAGIALRPFVRWGSLAQDAWLRVYQFALVFLIASPVVMLATRMIQVDRETRLIPPVSPRHWFAYPMGRRLDDQSFWAQVSAAIACSIIVWALVRIRRRHADVWRYLDLAPNPMWIAFSVFLTVFYVVRVYFQDKGNSFFYEFGDHPKEYRADPLMQQIQSWEGWQNLAVMWLAPVFFPVAWRLLRVARARGPCDDAGSLAALACLNTAIGPISLLTLFQVHRGLVMLMLGEDPRIFKDFGWALGMGAMGLQLLPLIVLFVASFYWLKLGPCVRFGSLAEDWLDDLSTWLHGKKSAAARVLGNLVPLARIISWCFVGFWYRRVHTPIPPASGFGPS